MSLSCRFSMSCSCTHGGFTVPFNPHLSLPRFPHRSQWLGATGSPWSGFSCWAATSSRLLGWQLPRKHLFSVSYTCEKQSWSPQYREESSALITQSFAVQLLSHSAHSCRSCLHTGGRSWHVIPCQAWRDTSPDPLFAIAYASAACGEAEHFRPTQVSGLDSLKLSAKRTPSKLIVLPWSELSHIRPPPSSYHSWFLLAGLQEY